MQFIKLRLAGFKSFVEPTEFFIEPGLTGVVGPNGCGKSNLVEALRWVMGENRVKQMRGGEMDDVIFAGTSARPARNVAEVAVLITNDQKKAPAAWNDLSEIEVSRRIERGEGSAYRISGKEARARDVQLFFADIASGSHSPALVSQGRIAAIINAKPAERRQVLEEAAGITGLHARRHEAELKLRAAEQNLARLDDVITTLDTQLQALKKQAKQAERYRNLAGLIRRAEAILLTLRWREADATNAAAAERLQAAEQIVTEATLRVATATTQLAEISVQLPDLRKAEAEAAAKTARLDSQAQALDEEEARVKAAIEDLIRRLTQLAGDRTREESRRHDAAAAIERLQQERVEIEETATAAESRLEEVRAVVDRQRFAVNEREEAVAQATGAVAAAEAERSALQRQVNEIETRLAELTSRLHSSDNDRLRLEASAIPADQREAAEAEVGAAESSVAAAQTRVEAAEAARRVAQEEERGARNSLSAAESELAKIEGEVTAPLDSTAPAHWHGTELRDADPRLPVGAEPLAAHVQAPAALARRLAQIGLIDDALAPGAALNLATGQRLVTRAGALWRWDGFTVKAGAPSAAATRLAQRNRLNELLPLRAAALAQLEAVRQRMTVARQAEIAASEDERGSRQTVRAASEALDTARRNAARLARQSAEQSAQLAALVDRIERLTADRASDDLRRVALVARLGELPDIDSARAQLQDDRRILQGERDELSNLQSEHARLAREREGRARRLAAIGDETTAWQNRAGSADAQLAQLLTRIETEETERLRLEQQPAAIAARRTQIIDLVTAAEAERRAHADALIDAEARARDAERALKAEEATLMAERETRVRAEAQAEQAIAHVADVTARIRERLDCAPEETLATGGVDPEDELPSIEQIDARVERLTRERDNVGPVNLRAEQEAEELELQVQTMIAEKDDLLGAIAKLRQGIGSLNREGRERLVAAFDQVNKHFQELFSALFGGGAAHLQLSAPPAEEGEPVNNDPLDAGLEVMASPPGKKLQSLSLLSGGEQALTALALLFAVFLTTPAPICVLDEVDAPLDDANVDRFCKLLDTISSRTQTRFVVVTHHRMTMARMDRLFGVTMAERGVSQLVSVDLTQAERMRATG